MEEWRLIEGTTDAFVSTGGAIAIGGVTITPKEDSEGYLRCTVAPKYRDRVHRYRKIYVSRSKSYLENIYGPIDWAALVYRKGTK